MCVGGGVCSVCGWGCVFMLGGSSHIDMIYIIICPYVPAFLSASQILKFSNWWVFFTGKDAQLRYILVN